MWEFEEFLHTPSRFFTGLLSTPLGIVSLIAVVLLIVSLITWLFISHRVKRRR
jgi:hypothetical protein